MQVILAHTLAAVCWFIQLLRLFSSRAFGIVVVTHPNFVNLTHSIPSLYTPHATIPFYDASPSLFTPVFDNILSASLQNVSTLDIHLSTTEFIGPKLENFPLSPFDPFLWAQTSQSLSLPDPSPSSGLEVDFPLQSSPLSRDGSLLSLLAPTLWTHNPPFWIVFLPSILAGSLDELAQQASSSLLENSDVFVIVVADYDFALLPEFATMTIEPASYTAENILNVTAIDWFLVALVVVLAVPLFAVIRSATSLVCRVLCLLAQHLLTSLHVVFECIHRITQASYQASA